MARTRLVLELGFGTDVRGGDCTRAAARALRDALGRHDLSVAGALGRRPQDLEVAVRVGVPRPEAVDAGAVLEVLPWGRGSIEVVRGGLEIPGEDGTDVTVMAHAAAVVYLDT